MTEVRQRFDVRQQHQHQQPSSPLYDNDVSGEAEDHQAAATSSNSSPALVPADLKLVQLRTELKKLGLSPSGLKHVLVKRLEEALARLGRGGSQARSSDPNNNSKKNLQEDDDEEDDDDGGDDDDAAREPEVQPQSLSFPSINRPPLLARSSAVKGFARRGGAGQHLLHTSDDGADDNLEDLARQGRQRHRRQPQQQQRSPHGDEGDDAEGFDDDYDEAYVGAHASSGSLLDRKDAPSKKRKLPPSSSSSSSSTSSSSSSSKQRSRHGKPASKKQRPSLSSLSSLVDAMATTPLSGHTFVKEARYAHPQQQQQQQQPVEEIKSLEQFRFEDSTFHFTYQFWRGQTLLHSFEIEAGTFTVLDEADADQPASPPPSADAPATSSSSSSSSTTTTSMTSTSSTATTMTTTMTTSTRQRRVVLRWPSPVYYPLLQTWRFHQTYSHLLLHEPSVSDVGLASSVPSSPAPSILTHSAPSSYPSSPLTAPSASAAVPCLISRLGSVFVPSTTEE